MTCKYCGQEERYGHDAMCVMNIVEDLRAEVERLTNAIRRIDGINDNPADYNPAINAVCDAILRDEPRKWVRSGAHPLLKERK